MDTINIDTARLLEEMRQKSHLETQRIKDAEEREAVRAGVEKTDELTRCVMYADAQLCGIIGRYMEPDLSDEGSDTLGLPSRLAYRLLMGERRRAGKIAVLAETFHSYLVNMALSKYYASVAMTELAAARANLAAADVVSIIQQLNSKMPPV